MFDRYMIFLPDRCAMIDVGCSCIKKHKKNIILDLSDKGVNVQFKTHLGRIVREGLMRFDDEFMPKMNTLYTHLLAGEYYSSTLYSRKKNEKEREILFLLAGKLGASNISYTVEQFETTVTNADASINVSKFDASVKFNKDKKKSNEHVGKETYLNRGAPIYTLSKNISQVEDNIRKQFGKLNNVFSYEFYSKNAKLKSFVYKRYNFKMLNVEYTTESDEDEDFNFEVKATLMSYGLGINFDKHINVSEKVTYKIDFFLDSELRLKLNDIMNLAEDKFATVREVYDAEPDKEIGIYHISEYVRRYAEKCEFICIVGKVRKRETYSRRLDNWIKEHNVDEFNNECKKFTSSFQIRTWFRSNLILTNEEVKEIKSAKTNNSYGILKLQNRRYKSTKKTLMESDNYPMCDDDSIDGSMDGSMDNSDHSIMANDDSDLEPDNLQGTVLNSCEDTSDDELDVLIGMK